MSEKLAQGFIRVTKQRKKMSSEHPIENPYPNFGRLMRFPFDKRITL